MLPVDLYKLSRINDLEVFTHFYHVLSRCEKVNKIKEHEKNSILNFVDTLIANDVELEFLKFFYLSFEISQIGKEFDLLRINNEVVLNIELKSQNVDGEKIKNQLLKNKYYLSYLSREIILVTYVASINKFYLLNDEDELSELEVEELKVIISKQLNCMQSNIDNIFRVSDYLISPLNTPDKFTRSEYFLTPQQTEHKKSIIEVIRENESNLYLGITGGPGTGKTLMLYDIAKQYSEYEKTCIIHCGMLSHGHFRLDTMLSNLDVYSASDFDKIDFSEYKKVFVDESHRFYINQYEKLIEMSIENNITICFSYDERQVLSKAEHRNDVTSKIKDINNFIEYSLTNKIRTNKELASFIRRFLNLNHTDKQLAYPSVSLAYANNKDEAKNIIQGFKNYGYKFINYTTSRYNRGSFEGYEYDYNTHEVIGQEFDKVLMIITKSFRYNNKYQLIACTHPNPDYLYRQLLFQGLTRVREKLAIVIVGNIDVFSKALSIIT